MHRFIWVEHTAFRKVALLLVVLLSLTAACTPTPVYTISGRVSGSWQCVDMASTIHPPTITLNPPGWTRSFSRAEPAFSFDNVREGDYSLAVTCTAHGSTYPAMPVTVAGEDLTVDVVLPFPQLPRRTARIMPAGHIGRVRSLAFSPGGTELVSAAEDGAVSRWDAITGELIKTWRHGHTDPLFPLRLSPDGATLAAGAEDGTIQLWDSVEGSLLHNLPGVGVNVTDLTFSDDGDTLAAWSDADDDKVALWDVTSGEYLSSIDVVGGEAPRRWPDKSILFLPDSVTMISAVSDNRNLSISRWDGNTGSLDESTTLSNREVRMLSGITSVDISADGTRVALGMIGIENHGGLLIWDINDSRSVVGNYEYPLSHIGFSPDGALVASTAHDNAVVLWDPDTGEARIILVSELEGIDQFAWSPTGRVLAAADEQGKILLWQIPPGNDIPSM